MKRLPILVLIFSVAGMGLNAQSVEDALRPITSTYALQNATIITEPGERIEKGTLIIKDGLIQAVGTDVDIPVDAKVINADSMYVYAGFIDGLSHTGVDMPDEDDNRRPEDPGNPPNEMAGIMPNRLVRDLLNPEDKSIGDLRKLGFTAAHVVPEGNMLPGKGALILLAGASADDMIYQDQTSTFATLSGAGRVYPATVIGVMSKFRELYKQAEQAQAHDMAYQKNPKGMKRPMRDEVLEALYPVVSNEQRVFFVAEDVKDAYRVMTLQKELNFPLVLTELKEGWHIADDMLASNIPALLSMELPDEPKESKAEEEEEEEAKSDTDRMMREEMKKLETRRAEAMQQYVGQAAVLADKGVIFAFSTREVKEKDLRANLRRMIAGGLSEDRALAALTTTPANMLGVDNSMGTVERGKLANLVVTDKPYFEEESNVRMVFVGGEKFEYEVKAKKSGDPNATVALGGTWSYVVNVPGQEAEGKLIMSDADGVISGTIENDRGGSSNLQNPVLTGNELTFSTTYDIDGQSLGLDFSLIIDGDTFEGSVDVGQFGTFEVEGSRESGPEKQ